jgi:peptidylprolyl isomerase
MTQAKSGDKVRIHYTGKLSDGTTFDSSDGGDPLEFELGAGSIIPGLEQGIIGMAVGDSNTVNIPATDAYGPHHAEAVQTVERSEIPDHVELAVGGQLQAQAPNGQQLMLTVVELTDVSVTLDANHPLAGKDLTFNVELVEIVAG